MVWKIRYLPRADKQFGKLDPQTRAAIAKYLNKRVLAAHDPRELGKALTGDKSGLWRYRVDKYRIICQIQDQVLIVLVIEIGKRDTIYDH